MRWALFTQADQVEAANHLAEREEQCAFELGLEKEERQEVERELATARGHLDRLTRRLQEGGLAELLWKTHDARPDDIRQEVQDLTEAVLAARTYLSDWLVIPDGVEHELQTLDSTPNGFAWGNTTFRGLRPLAAFAQARADGFEGDFWLWCERGEPLTWPATPKKLFMRESETVANGEKVHQGPYLPRRLGRQPVGPAVHGSPPEGQRRRRRPGSPRLLPRRHRRSHRQGARRLRRAALPGAQHPQLTAAPECAERSSPWRWTRVSPADFASLGSPDWGRGHRGRLDAALRGTPAPVQDVRTTQRAAAGQVAAGWRTSLEAMRGERAHPVEAGRWLGGPRTLLYALGVQQLELKLTAGLAWLLRPDGHHRLGSRVLAGMLTELGVPYEGDELSDAVVVVEETRLDDAEREMRADLVVYARSWTVVVEAKVHAGEQHEQLERLHSLWGDDPGPFFVFLTRGRRTPLSAGPGAGDWHNVTWGRIAAIAREATHGRQPAPGVCDFIETVEVFHHD